MTEDTKAAENEVEENVEEEVVSDGPEKINILSIAIPESGLKKALDVLFANTFGNQANKKIYALQKEIQPYLEEYAHLRGKIAKNPVNVDGDKFSGEGMIEFLNLNKTFGMKEVEFKCELPIKVQFLDCFSSNNRMVLEVFGICEFED